MRTIILLLIFFITSILYSEEKEGVDLIAYSLGFKAFNFGDNSSVGPTVGFTFINSNTFFDTPTIWTFLSYQRTEDSTHRILLGQEIKFTYFITRNFSNRDNELFLYLFTPNISYNIDYDFEHIGLSYDVSVLNLPATNFYIGHRTNSKNWQFDFFWGFRFAIAFNNKGGNFMYWEDNNSCMICAY